MATTAKVESVATLVRRLAYVLQANARYAGNHEQAEEFAEIVSDARDAEAAERQAPAADFGSADVVDAWEIRATLLAEHVRRMGEILGVSMPAGEPLECERLERHARDLMRARQATTDDYTGAVDEWRTVHTAAGALASIVEGLLSYAGDRVPRADVARVADVVARVRSMPHPPHIFKHTAEATT